MHPTADTVPVIYFQGLGAAGDAGRYAAKIECAMKRRLSSLVNPLYKFAPVVLFCYGLYWLTKDFRAERLASGLLLLLMWGFLAKLASRLKRVYLAGDSLYVSNYLRRVRIPLADVAAVEESSFWGWQPRTVAVELRTRSEFGERIVFIPRGVGFMAAEVAEEINVAVAAQHNNGMHPTADTKVLK